MKPVFHSGKKGHIPERCRVKQAPVGDPQGRDHGQCEEGKVHERIRHSLHLAGSSPGEMTKVLNDIRIRERRHQPGTIQRENNFFVPDNHDHCPFIPEHFLNCPADLGVGHPYRDDIVRVVGDTRRDRSPPESESVDETNAACLFPVPVTDDDFKDVTREIGDLPGCKIVTAGIQSRSGLGQDR